MLAFPGQEATHTLQLLVNILHCLNRLSWAKANQRLKAINTLSLTLITQACETYLIQNSRPIIRLLRMPSSAVVRRTSAPQA
jgi:hypothetical protein